MGQTCNDCRFRIFTLTSSPRQQPLLAGRSGSRPRYVLVHNFPTEGMQWIKEVELVDLVDELKSSSSIRGISASWFLVSMYLIWILESRLIRSNNQSRATLWVLETCLIVGLLPFIIILIAASLSSNTYNKASWRADWTFEGTESMSFIASISSETYGVCLHQSQVFAVRTEI